MAVTNGPIRLGHLKSNTIAILLKHAAETLENVFVFRQLSRLVLVLAMQMESVVQRLLKIWCLCK